MCTSINTGLDDMSSVVLNTRVLNGQVANDTSIIAALDSTQPPGYQAMVATPNGQTAQHGALIAGIPAENTERPSVPASTM